MLLSRSNPFDDIFNFQREMDRVFSQFWNDLPARTTSAAGNFQVNATDDAWQISVPLPGIDPQHVNLEAAGTTLSIRAEVPQGEGRGNQVRYQQTLTVPQFLDIEKLTATHQHGMLQLNLAPQGKRQASQDPDRGRRAGSEQRQLAGAGASRSSRSISLLGPPCPRKGPRPFCTRAARRLDTWRSVGGAAAAEDRRPRRW